MRALLDLVKKKIKKIVNKSLHLKALGLSGHILLNLFIHFFPSVFIFRWG